MTRSRSLVSQAAPVDDGASPVLAAGAASDTIETLESAKRLVAQAIADGDAGSLHELRARASAFELYRARSGARDTANEAGEIKVRAERGLALLDIAAAPHGGDKASLEGAKLAPLSSLSTPTRAAIRKLASLGEEEFEERISVARADDVAGVSTSRVLKVGADSFTGSAMSSKTDLWSTPQDLFDELAGEFRFTLDVCATAENAKCKRFYTVDDDGLANKWRGVCWMNPPYGDAIGKWVAKAYESSLLGTVVVCLLPARVDTGWWWDYCRHGQIRFLRGRLKFGGGVNSAPFPSAVVVFPHTPEVVWWER